jgi:hypothetical protein
MKQSLLSRQYNEEDSYKEIDRATEQLVVQIGSYDSER